MLRSPCCRSFPYPGCQAQGCPEQLLFQFNDTAGTAPHTITEQWFSLFGGGENDQPYEPNPDARIRVYLDGATVPDLDFQLFFAHTIGVQSCVNYTQCPAGKTCSGVRTTCNDPKGPVALVGGTAHGPRWRAEEPLPDSVRHVDSDHSDDDAPRYHLL